MTVRGSRKLKPTPSEASSLLSEAVTALRRHYGPPAPPPMTDPFELVLWENVAYLAPPARRREAFELLRSTIGTNPTAILAATRRALERVTAHGILKSTFATKLIECARIAIGELGGDIGPATRGPIAAAKRALRSFPGIGEPGAEKILLFSGQQALLAPDSNGLRVLVRLGVVQEQGSYARTYAASRAVAEGLSADPKVMQEAHLLLQQHGRTLCKSTSPRCEICPLGHTCAYARGEKLRSDTEKEASRMIIGAHSIIYSKRPEADRAFLRDALGLPHIDVGDGWLIFGLPPAEVGLHPSRKNDVHEFYLMCDDIKDFVSEMKKRNTVCEPVRNQGWGLLTHVMLPGGGRLGVYEPRHARPEAIRVSKASMRLAKSPGHKRPSADRRGR